MKHVVQLHVDDVITFFIHEVLDDEYKIVFSAVIAGELKMHRQIGKPSVKESEQRIYLYNDFSLSFKEFELIKSYLESE